MLQGYLKIIFNLGYLEVLKYILGLAFLSPTLLELVPALISSLIPIGKAYSFGTLPEASDQFVLVHRVFEVFERI